MMKVSCKSCKWWDSENDDHNEIGECRRFPPMIPCDIHKEEDVIQDLEQPMTWHSKWCGEWLSKDEPFPWETPPHRHKFPTFDLPSQPDNMETVNEYIRENMRHNCATVESELREHLRALIREEIDNTDEHRSLRDGKETTD